MAVGDNSPLLLKWPLVRGNVHLWTREQWRASVRLFAHQPCC